MAADFFDGDMIAIFLAGGAAASLFLIACGVFMMFKSRHDLKRRTDNQENRPGQPLAEPGPGINEQSSVLQFMSRQFMQNETADTKVLKSKLIQAGYFHPMAGAWFFLWRFVGAAAAGLAVWLGAAWAFPDASGGYIHLGGLAGAVFGYLIPVFALDRIIGRRKLAIREGFPDFMDLMIVCAEAGLSMEAAMERITRELSKGYPALADNLTIVCLELRAGRTLSESLMRMAKRIAVDEARSFATLLQQSEELGSSLTVSLRVYSEEMRSKRMMRAEEKANALPAKLMVPMIMFIFPILIVTLLTPVIARVFNM